MQLLVFWSVGCVLERGLGGGSSYVAEDDIHLNATADVTGNTDHLQYNSSDDKVKAASDSNDIHQHSRDDKPKPYLCTVREKRFTWKKSLVGHQRLHSGEKPFFMYVM